MILQDETEVHEAEVQTVEPADNILEPYRRLIELQKQMVELAQQHEKTKRECAALREQMRNEMAVLLRPRQGLRQWTVRSFSSLLKRMAVPRKSGEENKPQRNGSSLRTTSS